MISKESINIKCDGVVLISHEHTKWQIDGLEKPLFVCTEMFFDIKNIEIRSWKLWSLLRKLKESSLQVVPLVDFLLPDDFSWLQRTAKFVSQQWYRPVGIDWSEFCGVSIGKCCEYSVQTVIMRRLKFAVAIKRLIKYFPDTFFFCDYAVESEEREILATFGISVNNFDIQLGNSETNKKKIDNSLFNYIIKTIRSCNEWLCKLLSKLIRTKEDKDIPIIVVFPGTIILKSLEIWLDEYTDKIRVVMPSISLRYFKKILKLIKAGAKFTDFQEKKITLPCIHSVNIKNRLVENCKSKAYDDLLNFDGLLLKGVFLRLFSIIIDDEFNSIYSNIEKATNMLSERKVKVIFLPNDTQAVYKTWALVAKRFDTKTLTLQHGHPMYFGGGNHLTSDYSAFWSKSALETYTRIGVDPSYAFITGFPYSDKYIGIPDLKRIKEDKEIKILIITTGNPGVQPYIDETWAPEFIFNVLRSLYSSILKLNLTVKLHPGESSKLYSDYLRPVFGKKVKFIINADLRLLLRGVDVVISPPSTAILEALMLEKPVIYLPCGVTENMEHDYSALKNVIKLSKYTDLAESLNLIVQNEFSINKNGIDVSEYVGLKDGQSSKRLMDVIYKLASQSTTKLAKSA